MIDKVQLKSNGLTNDSKKRNRDYVQRMLLQLQLKLCLQSRILDRAKYSKCKPHVKKTFLDDLSIA